MARIAITGATGLLGSALAESLEGDGHEVLRITRTPRPGSDDVGWDIAARTIDHERLEGTDAMVHLAGEPIGAARWTTETRRRIHDSRAVGTELLARTLVRLDDPPEVLVSGSAVGYYGSRGDELLTEASSPGDDFLATVCIDWEKAADPARVRGIRVVHPRTGVVIAAGGDLIAKVERPFRLGIGGRVGSGRQFVPWIALGDHVRALRHLIDRDVEGPVNVVGPEPVTNRELTQALGTALHRPTVLPVPVFGVRLLYGRMGVTLATSSQRAVPEVLDATGFTFTHTELLPVLEGALGTT